MNVNNNNDDDTDELIDKSIQCPTQSLMSPLPESSLLNTSLRSDDSYFTAINESPRIDANQLIPESYDEYLCKNTNKRFVTLKNLYDIQMQMTEATNECDNNKYNIYGIVQSIVNTDTKKFGNSRELLLIDPTLCDGINIHIRVLDNVQHIPTRNIVRLTNVHFGRNLESPLTAGFKNLIVKERHNFGQIHSFTYDYELEDDDVLNRVFQTDHSDIVMDKSIAKYLEQWFCHWFLSKNSLKNIPVSIESSKTFADFACMVIASQLMSRSIVLTVWDGNMPNLKVRDQFESEHAHYKTNVNTYYRFNRDEALGNDFMINPQHFVYVNVWGNESNVHTHHYDVAYTLKLTDGDDLIILFNVEVRKCDDTTFALTLRSGRQFGKGIRKVSRGSVLGRRLMLNIRDAQQRAIQVRRPEDLDSSRQSDRDFYF